MSRSIPKVKIMDGAMGTMLISLGVPIDSCFEELNLRRPNLIFEIHRSYIESGAEVIVANTFRGKHLREGIRIARKAANTLPVFASIGPLGMEARRISMAQMMGLFRQRAETLEEEGLDGYVIETMTSLREAEAATRAVRHVSDKTIMTLMVTPPSAPKRLREAGADILGINCGTGPEEAYDRLKTLSLMDPGPLCVRPSAGLPHSLSAPEEFAQWGKKFQRLGARWIGGCCGTTPAHIRALAEKLKNRWGFRGRAGISPE